jgi:hypothetical protein
MKIGIISEQSQEDFKTKFNLELDLLLLQALKIFHVLDENKKG